MAKTPKKTAPIIKKDISVSRLPAVRGKNPIIHHPQVELFIDKQKEIDGVGMGVLSDGTAFLSGRGLSRLCGVSNARIVELGQNWSTSSTNALTKGVKKILEDKGINIAADSPYIEIKQGGLSPGSRRSWGHLKRDSST